MGQRPIDDVAKLLAELDGSRDRRELIHTRIAVLGELYRLERISLSSAILQVYGSSVWEDVLSPDQVSTLYQLEDSLSLAEEGIYATMEDVRREFTTFMEA